MKKRIIFYICWDVLFIIFLYIYYNINSWAEYYYYRQVHFYPVILAHFILPIIIGGFISWLVVLSSQYQFTRKLAVLELAIIGGLAFYLVTVLVLPSLVAFITGENILRLAPAWLYNSSDPRIIGSILFGYELFIFIIRMVNIKQIKNPSESE